MNINNKVYEDDRIKDKQHFLDFLQLTGYDEIDITELNPNMPPESPPNILQEVLEQVSEWSFDGSSTSQALIDKSDLMLKPVKIYMNPFSTQQRNSIPSFIVYCEVYNTDGTPKYDIGFVVDDCTCLSLDPCGRFVWKCFS